MPWRQLTRQVALCPDQHRGREGDPCSSFAAAPTWCAFPGWPLPPDGQFSAELVVVGQGPGGTASALLRHQIDADAGPDARAQRAWELSLTAHVTARFHRLHVLPLVRDVFATRELPWSRVFFTEAVFCPRTTGVAPALETVAQCASLHLRSILAQPSVRVVLCLGDDAVMAVTGRYRWEPWRALHGRVQRRSDGPTLIYAVHPMAAREGGGQPWSRPVRGKLAELIRAELADRDPAR
jgi:uracil-DNA glycosylase